MKARIATRLPCSEAELWERIIEPGSVEYSDEIEIRAGLLTPVIWAFAHGFYRHRQRRWRVLLSRMREKSGEG